MKQKTNFRILISLLCLLLASCTPRGNKISPRNELKENRNTRPYPFKNPVIRHMYTADAAPKVMPDGRVWMVTSVDHEDGGGYATMHKYHTFSTADMVNWIDHGEIFNIQDASGFEEEPTDQDWALWAPDMIYSNGKYYLYYPVRMRDDSTATAQGDNGISYIAVAVSDHPSKRFRIANPHIKGTEGIDPSVFIDDDGQAYLYWGNQMAARLADNMTELAEEPVKLDLGTDKFMEAIWMDKHQGRYIVSYHTLYDWKLELSAENIVDPDRVQSELAYSYSDSPMGPFTYGGTLNYEPGVNVPTTHKLFKNKDFVPWRLTLSNHGGILEYHQNHYLFYHTSALSSWRQDVFKDRGTWTQRSVCVDKLEYDSTGLPMTIQQTLEGVDSVSVNQPYQIVLSSKSTSIYEQNKVLKFENIDLGTGYYYFGLKAMNVEGVTRAEIRKDSADGTLMGTVIIDENGYFDTFLRNANGIHDIYLVFNAPVEVDVLRFFGGSPDTL